MGTMLQPMCLILAGILLSCVGLFWQLQQGEAKGRNVAPVTDAAPSTTAAPTMSTVASPSAFPYAFWNDELGVSEVNWASRPQWVGVRVVDVREADELVELPMIAEAEHAPLSDLATYAARWTDKSEPMVIICRTGRRSSRAVLQLRAMGFENLVSLQGGMMVKPAL